MTQLLLALDFGGTKHTVAVIAHGERRWRAHRRVFSPPDANANHDLETVCTLAHDLLARARPAAVGVSFGGPVDFCTGTVRLSHHVPGWEDTPLREVLEAEFGAPASVDNDANVAALGEHRFGAGQGCDSLMYITVSTGVGGGWILNGGPWRGADGMAGEIGHMVVDPHGPVCLCGKRGCVERFASGPYVAQRAREWLKDLGEPLGLGTQSRRSGQRLSRAAQPARGQALCALAGGNLETITARMVAQAAAQRDALAWEALEIGAWALGVGIGNTANLVNPERFVLGGGVTKAGDRWWEVVRRVACETALPEVHFDVVPAALGDDAPLWGAVALAEDRLVNF
jgi:glucokinase